MNKIWYLFISCLVMISNASLANEVQCRDPGGEYDVCGTGNISKLVYKKDQKAVLVSGISSPGCSASGWVLPMPDGDEEAKSMYSALLAAYMSNKSVSLSRVGKSCIQWNGEWKGTITEISLN